jgi:hypothetical protein
MLVCVHEAQCYHLRMRFSMCWNVKQDEETHLFPNCRSLISAGVATAALFVRWRICLWRPGALIALAERLNASTVITLDRRHFAAVKSRHVPAFNLLPEFG